MKIEIQRVGNQLGIEENGCVREFTGSVEVYTVGDITRIVCEGDETTDDNGWIKCSDRLPEEGETVWVNSEHGVRTGHWCERAYEEYFVVRLDGTGVIASNATHWRPLPAPPAAPLDH